MNEIQRAELNQLKERQKILQSQLTDLSQKISQFDTRLQQTLTISPVEIPAMEISSLKSEWSAKKIVEEEQKSPAVPAPLQPPVQTTLQKPTEVPPVISQVERGKNALHLQPSVPVERVSRLTPVPSPLNVPPPTPDSNTSFEMRLGTYWLVRAGIVLLLTGMAFFARYAYQNYIPHFGPLGKLILMYLGSGALLGTGIFLQRKKGQEPLRNYGQVLFAGGLAMIYFTTYAAHHVPNLRLISSPILDGALLLAWTGFIVWVADRKKSEVLALFAIGLAYYTSIITSIGLFTLYSNLVLTGAAVFFLLRNRWTTLSMASLIATYIAFVFWRFHSGEGWMWSSRVDDLWKGNLFLAGYWIIFTASTFLSKPDKSENYRAPFLTLNNGAFFALVLLSMMRYQQGNFWKFSAGFGAVLLVLAAVAKRVLPEEPSLKNSYTTQGLLLVTLAIISYFTGLRLALVLATESVALFVIGTARKNIFLIAGAYITAALAVALGLSVLNQQPEILSGTFIGALLLFNAFWAHRNCPADDAKNVMRPKPAYFSLLALIIWAATTWQNCPREWLAPTLAMGAAVLTLSIYFLRLPEVTIFSQGYLFLAQAVWLVENATHSHPTHGLNPGVVIAVTVGLSHWWQRQKLLVFTDDVRNFLLGLYALAVTGVLFFWLEPLFSPQMWLAVACLLAIALALYGLATKLWPLAITAQLFVLVSLWSFESEIFSGNLAWYIALVPIATLLLFGSMIVKRAFCEMKMPASVITLARIYRCIALIMSLAWIHQYIPQAEQFWVVMLVGTALFALAAKLQNRETFLFSGVFFVVGLGIFLFHCMERSTIFHWPNLVALFIPPVLQQLAKRRPARFSFVTTDLHIATICASAVTFWIYLSRWMILTSASTHLFLTASWAIFALILFIAGLLLKERVYRWLGLAVLACAVTRVFFFDIWKLETIYRILSFIALGLVLLVLGFLYNKYQEKIKEWI
ncbi:MAG: DUF2339 domain-containing protein [Verrucomicrobiota bacterium]|nr:DUF2339 domain-containing protein [Verrucomicrobiota bacterium]